MMDIDLAWANNAAAAYNQREVAERELSKMHAGNPFPYFATIGKILQQIYERVNLPRVRLLDAGCGSAYYYDVCEHYKPRWVDYTGVDYNVGMVELAKEKYPDLRIEQQDLRALSFAPLSFDIVLTGATVNSITDWRAALHELARVCKGYFILHRANILLDTGKRKSTYCVKGEAYGAEVIYWRWNRNDIIGAMAAEEFYPIETYNIAEPDADNVAQTWLFERWCGSA